MHACRFCGAPLTRTLVDLGMSPLCESFVAPEDENKVEHFYPLHAKDLIELRGQCSYSFESEPSVAGIRLPEPALD